MQHPNINGPHIPPPNAGPNVAAPVLPQQASTLSAGKLNRIRVLNPFLNVKR